VKRMFLVSYDYGSGGLWGAMMARSEEEIRERYPELTVVTERPKWMNEDRYQQIYDKETHDIDGAPWGILNALVADRSKGTGQ